MKVFTFKYVKDLKAFTLAKMQKAISAGVPSVEPDILYFDQLAHLMRSASTARLALFQAIVEKKPSSLYDLAQQTQKDQAYVLREVRALEGMGLIQLIEIKENGREKLRPEALYDKIVIDVEFK